MPGQGLLWGWCVEQLCWAGGEAEPGGSGVSMGSRPEHPQTGQVHLQRDDVPHPVMGSIIGGKK